MNIRWQWLWSQSEISSEYGAFDHTAHELGTPCSALLGVRFLGLACAHDECARYACAA